MLKTLTVFIYHYEDEETFKFSTNRIIIEVLRMSLFMNSSQEDTFRSLMDYFTGRRDKILVSTSPSLIRVEIGAYWSWSRGHAKGEAETTITKRDSGSYINFNFDFTKEYVSGFIVAIIGALLCYFVVSWVAGLMLSEIPSWITGNMWSIVNLIVIGGMVMIIFTVMALEGYNVSATRKRFIDEFNMFAQSLSTKK